MNSNLDVLLVRPWAPRAVPQDALVEDALGPGYLLANLRKSGFTAGLLDAFIFRFSDHDVIQSVLAISPKVLGISLHSFADYSHATNIARGVKQYKSDIFCVLGGEHATFLAKEILEKINEIDSIVMGEGEETFIEITKKIVSNSQIDRISGALTRNSDGTILDGGPRFAIADLDSLPYPHKDGIEIAISQGKKAAISLLTGRGCTHKCTFCTANKFLRLGGGEIWRRRKPEAVADELETIEPYLNKPGIHPMIQFQDVIFLGTSIASIKWAQSFVQELERRKINIPFYFMTRAEAIIANETLLPRLVKCGLRSVEIGIESGVDRILNLYNKVNSVEKTENAINLLQKNGIAYDASGFIMFDPRMTLDELRTSAIFLAKIEHATWDRYITRLQVFPGTVVRTQLIEDGIYSVNDSLDDVYSYIFQDSKMADVASHSWYYDISIMFLDNLMKLAKTELATYVREGRKPPNDLQTLLNIAKKTYNEYFLSLIDLANKNQLKIKFEREKLKFLQDIKTIQTELKTLLDNPILYEKITI